MIYLFKKSSWLKKIKNNINTFIPYNLPCIFEKMISIPIRSCRFISGIERKAHLTCHERKEEVGSRWILDFDPLQCAITLCNTWEKLHLPHLECPPSAIPQIVLCNLLDFIAWWNIPFTFYSFNNAVGMNYISHELTYTSRQPSFHIHKLVY